MGVLACERYGCSNIMCDRSSFQYGYICGDCFEELVQLGVQTDIDNFMGSEKNSISNAEASEVYFNEIFSERE